MQYKICNKKFEWQHKLKEAQLECGIGAQPGVLTLSSEFTDGGMLGGYVAFLGFSGPVCCTGWNGGWVVQ